MKMGDVMKESVFSLAEAKFTTGDFNHMVLQNVNKAQLKVRSKKDNVAGEFYCKAESDHRRFCSSLKTMVS